MQRYQITAAQVSEKNILQSEVSDIDNELVNELKQNIVKESIIDSRNIKTKVTRLMYLLTREKCSPIAKIKIAEFFCNKLCDIYRLSIEKRNVIIQELYTAVYEDNTLPIPVRLYYLRFRNETVPYPVSCQLYENGIRNRLETIPYFQILKYILKSYLITDEIRTSILGEFETIFADDNVSIYTKMEIADIYLLNRRAERGNEMLNIIRNLENERRRLDPNEAILVLNKRDRLMTVYGDTQNVHSTDINTSVLNACIRLIDLEQTIDFNTNEVLDTLLENAPHYRRHIETVLQRIEIDTSRFTVKDNSFSLYIVFASLWHYIKRHSSYNELKDRMIEEMVAMAKYCTTGHLSRFINVIQGYTDDEELQVRISDEEQIKSVVAHYLDTVLSDAPDNVVDAMISDDQKPFYDYIVIKMNIKIPSILEEYGNIQEHIVTAIKRYSRWDHWELMDNILKWINSPSEENLQVVPEQPSYMYMFDQDQE